MAENYGWESYAIFGKQSDWATPINVIGSMVPIVYELESAGLVQATTPTTPFRMKGNARPVKNIQGMITAGGPFQFGLHSSDMLLPFEQLLHASSISTVQRTAQEVRVDASYTPGSPFTLDTQPTATTPSTNPGKLKFTFTGASGTGTIVIVGTDYTDLAVTETIQTGAAPTTLSSIYYYKSVSAITVNVVTATSLQIDADPETWEHTLKPDNAVLDGLTVEFLKGADPNTYTGVLFNTGSINVGDEVTFSVETIGRSGDLGNAVDGTSTPSSLVGLTRPDKDLTPGWGTKFSVDSVDIPVDAATFSVNNGLAYRIAGRSLSRFQRKPSRQAIRETTLQASIDYDATDFNPKTLGVEFATDFIAASTPYGGIYAAIEVTMPQCEMVGYPDPAVTGPTDILQTLNIRAIEQPSDEEFSVKITNTQSGIPT